MRAIAIVSLLALSLSGCAELEQVAQVSTGVVCAISAASSAAGSAEAQVGAHQGITNEITVASADACAALNGIVAKVPAQ